MNSTLEPVSSFSTEPRCCETRVLCLGNDLLADDSFGKVVGDSLRLFPTTGVEVISTTESGFHLLDYLSNTHRLIVVDTIMTGRVPPGTVLVFRESELHAVSGVSPHYIGICDALSLARQLNPSVANEVMIVAVEAADCSTVGGDMHPEVRAAVVLATRVIRNFCNPRESLSPTTEVKTPSCAAAS